MASGHTWRYEVSECPTASRLAAAAPGRETAPVTAIGELFHDVAGEGPAVLLLHSGATDSRQWDAQWPQLTAAHRVVRYDRRGWGRSPLPATAYSDLGDAIGLLDDLGVDDVAVVGSSAGGGLALQLASAYPERVRRLVLLCAAADVVEPTPDVRAFGDREDELLEAGDVEGAVELNADTFLGPEADRATRELVCDMQRTAFEVQLAAGDDVAREPGPETDLARVTVPTLIVTGDLDLDFFGLVGNVLTQRLPDARRVSLPWAGHLPNLERPDEVTALLLAELAG